MKKRILTCIVRLKYIVLIPTLFLFLGSTALAQLSGTKYIGGTTPDYATIKAAILDLNTQGVTTPGVTFLIRDGVYAEDSLDISTATSSASAPVFLNLMSEQLLLLMLLLPVQHMISVLLLRNPVCYDRRQQ